MQKKVLLIGSSFAALPFVSRLKALSYEIHVCGVRPQEPCAVLADQYFSVDYSDPGAVRRILQASQYAAIIPDCNDVAYLTGATLAPEFNLAGFDSLTVTQTFLDKSLYRAYLHNQSIASPHFLLLQGALPADLASLTYPLLVKPVDSFSGRGVSKVANPHQVIAAHAMASQESAQHKVIIEEFIEGSLHSHSAFVRNGAIASDFIVDEFCTVYPYQVNCSHSPSALSDVVIAGLRAAIGQLISALNLVDGLIHTQFIVRDQQFYLIETTRRCPGDLYPELIHRASGADYIDLFLAPFLDLDIPVTTASRGEFWARHTISRDHDIVLGGVQNNIPSDHQIYFALRHVGEKVRAAPFGRVGIIFARFNDIDVLFNETPKMKNYITLHEL